MLRGRRRRCQRATQQRHARADIIRHASRRRAALRVAAAAQPRTIPQRTPRVQHDMILMLDDARAATPHELRSRAARDALRMQ